VLPCHAGCSEGISSGRQHHWHRAALPSEAQAVALQRCRPNSSLGGAQPDNSRRCAVQRDGGALLSLWQILGCLRRLPGKSVLPAALQCSKTHGMHHFWAVQHLAIYTAEVIHQLSGHACWLIAPMIMPLSLRWLCVAALCTLCKHWLSTLVCSLFENARFKAKVCITSS